MHIINYRTEQNNSPISYVFNVFTMTIGNVNVSN